MARVWFGVPGGYCRGVGKWSCMIDHGWLAANKRSSPSLEILITILFSKIFFNKDIEMSYDMLYRQEKNLLA
jgi:hypothetical protein